MTGKAKIESLTNSWYGYAAFSAVVALLNRGLGFFSILWTGMGLLFTWFVIYLIGSALTRRSSLTRAILICATAIFSVTGAIATGKMALAFISSFEISVLATAALAAVGAWMNAKSLKTLLDPQVKAYFG